MKYQLIQGPSLAEKYANTQDLFVWAKLLLLRLILPNCPSSMCRYGVGNIPTHTHAHTHARMHAGRCTPARLHARTYARTHQPNTHCIICGESFSNLVLLETSHFQLLPY